MAAKLTLLRLVRRSPYLLIIAVLLVNGQPLRVSAACSSTPPPDGTLSCAQKQVLDTTIRGFDTDIGACSGTGIFAGNSSPTDTGVSNSGTWNSGLAPPYILEQFAIETLKDVAQKKGVDPSNTVTEEHVVALVAFMMGEGGDIMNHDLYNPLNTGINAPDLVDGAHATNGVQSFKSFDAGVEATARTMLKPTQIRLAEVLIQKDSTAQQFMHTLTYYKEYPNNAFWAEASVADPASYYQARMGLVQQVRNNYADRAGLVIGTPDKEQVLNITAKAKLQFHPAGDKSSNADTAAGAGGSAGCSAAGNAVIAGNLAATAVNLSWPESHGLTPKPEYAAAINQFNPAGKSSANGADCGAFIATVMHATGVDANYPPLGTGTQISYIRSHPDKYSIVDSVASTAELMPGDIMILNGHTFMFVGPQAGGADEASASQGERMPSLGKTVTSDNRGNYARVRVLK